MMDISQDVDPARKWLGSFYDITTETVEQIVIKGERGKQHERVGPLCHFTSYIPKYGVETGFIGRSRDNQLWPVCVSQKRMENVRNTTKSY